MKQNLKKMLLALMVGIGMMGAVSVQAQTQEKVYVKVSDFYNLYISDEGVTGTVDQLCEAHVNAYDASYKYTGLWSWMGDRDIRCGVSTPTPSSTVGLQMRVHCLKGGSIDQELVGCYEQRDNCPDGTVKGKGDVCESNCKEGEVVQSDGSCGCPEGKEKDGEDCLDECELAEKRGETPPEGCPECPEKAPEFTDPLTGRKVRPVGAVACVDGKRKVCFWSNSISGWDRMDGTSQGIIRNCTIAHESSHKYDTTNACLSSGYVGHKVRNNQEHQNSLKGEVNAYQAQYDCLLKARDGKEDGCKGNQLCIKQMNAAMKGAEERKKWYENSSDYWAKHPIF